MRSSVLHHPVRVPRSAERWTRAANSEPVNKNPRISRLNRLKSELDEYRNEARQLGALQRSLLPHPLPQIPGLEIAASFLPCGGAGGDLYDLFLLDEARASQRWCVFLADASGHGLAAAAVMAMVQAILRAHPPYIQGAGDLLAHVNRHLCRKKISGFVTAFVGIYHPSTRELKYACAGHPPPLFKTGRCGISRLDAVANCPLGIIEGEIWADATIHIQPGDVVLFYTDGITEARNASDDMFSEERLQLVLQEWLGHPATLIERIEKDVVAYRQGRTQGDDQTLVAISATDT